MATLPQNWTGNWMTQITDKQFDKYWENGELDYEELSQELIAQLRDIYPTQSDNQLSLINAFQSKEVQDLIEIYIKPSKHSHKLLEGLISACICSNYTPVTYHEDRYYWIDWDLLQEAIIEWHIDLLRTEETGNEKIHTGRN